MSIPQVTIWCSSNYLLKTLLRLGILIGGMGVAGSEPQQTTYQKYRLKSNQPVQSCSSRADPNSA